MLAYEVWIDGERQTLAGVSDWAVLSAHVTAVKERPGRREGELNFSVGGLTEADPAGLSHHVIWSKLDLRVGSEIRIKVVESDSPDQPARRYRSDREVQESPFTEEEIEGFEREEFERLKAKFEAQRPSPRESPPNTPRGSET